MFEVTVISKIGGPLTKRIHLDGDHLVNDSSACVMSHGSASRFSFNTAQEFADLIGRLGASQAIALGALREDLADKVEVVTKRRMNGAVPPIARTNEFFVYRPLTPAYALVDFDQKGMPEPMKQRLAEQGGAWQVLASIIPGLAGTTRVERRSTSAGLCRIDTGEQLGFSGGMHYYIAVKDGADIERFLRSLHDRCWLAGFGFMMVGAGGQFLERSIVDRVVGSAERLSFEGAPVLVPPIAQDKAARRPIATEGEPLDTLAACPSLSISDQVKLDELRAQERRRLAPAAAKERKAFVDRQSERLAARTGADLESARKTVERWADGVLLPDIVLQFDDPDLEGKTVGDILADPARYDGETLADPLEGIEYGRCKARIMRRADGTAWIRSFAHGFTAYHLKLDYKSAKAVMGKATEDTAAQTFVDVTLAGDDFAVDEVETLRNLANDLSGINKRTLSRKLRDARYERRGTSTGTDLRASELLDLFNAQYAVVNEAGKAMVYERVRDPQLERNVLVRMRFDDFKKFHQNFLVEVTDSEGRIKHTPAGEYWLNHKGRRQYLGGVVFDPTGKVGPDYWNLWDGFAVESRPGDWGLMRDHIHKIICCGNIEQRDYLLNTIARMFQQPNRPAEVAVVLRGLKGAGKGVLCNQLVKAWGQHGVHVAHAKHLVGNFNDHLRDCVMLFADEAFFAGDRQHEGVLKMLITEPTLPIEGKHMNVVFVPNMLHVYMSSNSEWVVPASHDERRYFVLDVLDTRVGDRAYFNTLNAQMENGGLAAMIYDMLHRDISRFDPREVPSTEALKTQKMLSLDSLDRWWLDILERGFVWRSRHGVAEFAQWQEICSTELLRQSYLQWCTDNREMRPQPRVALGKRLTEMYRPIRPRGGQITGEVEVRPPSSDASSLVVKASHVPGYEVLSLDEARARFAEIRGVTGTWGQIDE